MKLLYVNGINAKHFDTENKKKPVFAKYFSPTCPACIAMETEWDDMCKDIEQKYNTDMIMAQIDPDGMNELENMETTYSDVQYVPALILLKNGKKVGEYEGPKDKNKMIDFLMKNGLITLKSNIRGGAKKSRKRIHKGSGSVFSQPNSNEEFSFINSKEWLEPFLSKLLEQTLNDPSKIISETDAIDFAIKNVNSIFRPKGLITKEFVQYKKDWEECPKYGLSILNSECRNSPGFGNRRVPSVRKFDPKFREDKYKYNVKLAEQSYNYLKNSDKINTLLRTRSSDAGYRFSLEEDRFDKEFLTKLRDILASQQESNNKPNYFKAILTAYTNTNTNTNTRNETHENTKDIINIMDVPLDELHLYKNGGNKLNRRSRKVKSRKVKSRKVKSRKSRRMKIKNKSKKYKKYKKYKK